jgi:hypothetical protein
VDLAEQRLLEGGGVEAMRSEIAGDPTELFGAAEAAEVRRALDHAGALASTGEEQGGVEAGDPPADDQGLRAGGAHSMRPRSGLLERAARPSEQPGSRAMRGPGRTGKLGMEAPPCRFVENVSQYQFKFGDSAEFA